MQQSKNPLAEDLDHILNLTGDLWEQMRGKNLFVTGGTGYFGCWILESFFWANEKLDLQASVVVLTRNADAFRKNFPRLANNSAASFTSGDVSSFEFPEQKFDFIIHAATDVYSRVNPLQAIDTIVEGTRRVLEFAKRCGAKKVLMTSSGAVYGRQPVTLSHIGEDYEGSPNPVSLDSAYGEGKRLAELLCAIYTAENDIDVTIARFFASVGPYLQLNGHLAVGNFICDALNGNPIEIKSDGTPVRSYLYASDSTVWLWTILFRGKAAYPYNIGSERDISLADLAEIISRAAQKQIEVKIAKKKPDDSSAALPERYVPSARRAFDDLQLRATVDLETAIKKTLAYYEYTKDYKIC